MRQRNKTVRSRGRSTRSAWPMTVAMCASVHIMCHQFMNAAKRLRNDMSIPITLFLCSSERRDILTSRKNQNILLLVKLKRFYMYPKTSVKVRCGEHMRKWLNNIYSDIGVPYQSLNIDPNVRGCINIIISLNVLLHCVCVWRGGGRSHSLYEQ